MGDVYEQCVARIFLKNGEKEVGCKPFGLSLAAKENLVFNQAIPLCNPSATGWYHSHSKDKFSCITSCQGVYADVNYSNETMTEKKRKLFDQISTKYKKLKTNFYKNIQFKGDAHTSDLVDYGRFNLNK